MLTSRYRAEGHTCLPLADLAGKEMDSPVCRIGRLPSVAAWTKQLRASEVVGAPGEFKPLILDAEGRLYLRRYWEYEQQLVQAIAARTATAPPDCDQELLARGLQSHLPGTSLGAEPDWQQIAAFAAVTHNFCVITGGPGTGKTQTVVRILALLLAQARGAKLRIALAAPTGKAAARLTDSLRSSVTLPEFKSIAESLPNEATTIHRLLGTRPDSPHFWHNASRPLVADVVVVDEASMVDLALMAKLFAAVPLAARLILLGDENQLASVEAGNVLADICGSGASGQFSKEFVERYAEITGERIPGGMAKASPLQDCIVELQRNYRFAEAGGIYQLSRAVNAGDAGVALSALKNGALSDVHWRKLPAATALEGQLREQIISGFRSFLEAPDPASALARLQQFRILCAVRHGPFGVENLNVIAEQTLADAGLLQPNAHWYAGRPVMITRNDYNLALFNGDTGIILRDPAAKNELRAFFLSAEGKLRVLLPSRLPLHETAFAATVHKSQGSEVDELILILPAKDSPLLTRELIYTGITRARSKVTLFADEAVFRAAVARQILRASGLRGALWPAGCSLDYPNDKPPVRS